MPSKAPSQGAVAAAYAGPFAAYLGIMLVETAFSPPPEFAYPIRFLVVSLLVVTVSRPYWVKPPSRLWASSGIGAAVFILWIAPDILFDYRQSWLFHNAITGVAVSSIPVELRTRAWFVLIRTAGSTLLVPIVEELFFRGWLMRFLIHHQVTEVPLGKYKRDAFWLVAMLFGMEHGPYWEVGLITGVIYNWWMIRTRNLGDCIVMHAVTNGLLSAYVVMTGRWEYLF